MYMYMIPYTCHIHNCRMQLVIYYNLFYTIVWKLVACDSCDCKLLVSAKCKMEILLSKIDEEKNGFYLIVMA